MIKSFLFFVISMILGSAYAQHSGHSSESKSAKPGIMHMSGTNDCAQMMVWDKTSYSCIALPMPEMPVGMWMLHGNGFVVQSFQEGSRGKNRLSSPNMLMNEVGKSYGNQYFNANLMLTLEKWTFPKEGYPELLQIGEKNQDDQPYIDAQHPHSSPILGLTFSDTISLGEGKDYVRFFFAPRGQATEGPVAFMHRPTGMVNPDAPLGHHIGQDVSHITSTVLGFSLSKGRTQLEISAFHGTEPEPAMVDLPMGTLNSYGARIAYDFSNNFFAMFSAAEVNDPEPHDPTLKKLWRYSGSIYSKHQLNEMMLFNTFIYGLVNNYDHISALRSVLDEFLFHEKDRPNQYWGRFEFVERTATELAIPGLLNPDEVKLVTAVTAGYTYKIKLTDEIEAGVGSSITKYFLPSDFRTAYSGDPLSGRIFIQITGMKMGEF